MAQWSYSEKAVSFSNSQSSRQFVRSSLSAATFAERPFRRFGKFAQREMRGHGYCSLSGLGGWLNGSDVARHVLSQHFGHLHHTLDVIPVILEDAG